MFLLTIVDRGSSQRRRFEEHPAAHFTWGLLMIAGGVFLLLNLEAETDLYARSVRPFRRSRAEARRTVIVSGLILIAGSLAAIIVVLARAFSAVQS
jgi:hypothetical protein